jgi:phenylpropionate dioxygenase-like ring-hydroxylating dioxygenase large terminal subunit
MEHETQVAQGRRILDYLETRGTTLADAVYLNPVADYTCPEQFAAEGRRFFRELPLVMGLGAELPEPGDYLTDDFAGVPILLVRGDDGRINAFLNVCRHRGARVAEGRGRVRKAFVCPYHAWSYGRNGCLLGRPHAEAFAGVAAERHGLRPLPVVERHGLLWVRPSPGEDFDLDAGLAGLGAELAAYGFAGYHLYDTRVLRQKMNWKLVVDTFLETYHLNVLHRKTIDPIILSNLGAFDPFGRNLRMIAARRTIGELKAQPEAEWDLIRHTAVVYVLFPNTVLIMQGDHLETWRVFPDEGRPDRAVMHIGLYTPEPAISDSARRHWERNFQLLLDTVEKEDFPVGESIQRGFLSGAQAHIAFGRNEPALGHYHRQVREALA